MATKGGLAEIHGTCEAGCIELLKMLISSSSGRQELTNFPKVCNVLHLWQFSGQKKLVNL